MRHANALPMWARIQALILTVPTRVPVGAEISERTGLLAADLRRRGVPIGAMDPFIAATALQLGLPIVTHNTSHFMRTTGLEVLDWYIAQ